jgi:hypothetical protein
VRRVVLTTALVLVALALGACGSSSDERASGVTERWLQALSDTGRSSVSEDAMARAARDGDPEIGAVLGDGLTDDDAYFDDLEVGRAIEDGDTARVPLRVTRNDDREVFATAVLSRRGSSWRVDRLEPPRPDERVPSRGGDRAASASARHWLAAIAVGGVVTVLSALVIELQPVPDRTRRLVTPSG